MKAYIPSHIKNPRLIQERRQQIIDGAVDLFTKKGFHKTTTREIAKACRLSIGSLYEYIQTKEDVLYLVCEYIHDQLEEEIRQVIDPRKNGFDNLHACIYRYFQLMGTMRPSILIIYQETKSLPKEMREKVLEREEGISQLFIDLIESGRKDRSISVESEEIPLLAHNILVLAQMWVFRYWSLKKRYTHEEFTKLQINHILKNFTR